MKVIKFSGRPWLKATLEGEGQERCSAKQCLSTMILLGCALQPHWDLACFFSCKSSCSGWPVGTCRASRFFSLSSAESPLICKSPFAPLCAAFIYGCGTKALSCKLKTPGSSELSSACSQVTRGDKQTLLSTAV